MSERVRVRMADDRHLFLESPSLVVGASWREDRWLLGIAHPTSSGRRALLTQSYPDHPDDDGKLLRPVFQQCYCRQTSSQTGELLLVGQCGRRHFSGVVTLSPGRVRIDLADRWTVPIPLSRFGMEFQVPPPTTAEVTEKNGGGIRLEVDGNAWLLTPEFIAPLPGIDAIFQVDEKRRTAAVLRPVREAQTPPMTIAYGVGLIEERSK